MSALRFGASRWRNGKSAKNARGCYSSGTTVSSAATTPAGCARVTLEQPGVDVNNSFISVGCFPAESVFITTTDDTDGLKMQTNSCGNDARAAIERGRRATLDRRTRGKTKREDSSNTTLGFNRNASLLFGAAQPFTRRSRRKKEGTAAPTEPNHQLPFYIDTGGCRGGKEEVRAVKKAAIPREDEEPLSAASPKIALGNDTMVDNGARWAHNVRVVLPHVLLYTATAVYSVLGAVVFHRLELPFETEHLNRYSAAIIDAQNALIHLRMTDADYVLDWRKTSTSMFNESIDNAIDALIRVSMDAFAEGIKASDLTAIFQTTTTAVDDDDTPASADATNFTGHSATTIRPKWNFHSSLFFTTTLLTSIGYGNLVPISPVGRIFCICYAILGIPLTLITIADVAKFFADVLLNAPTKWQRLRRRWRRCVVAVSNASPSSARPSRLYDANGFANNLNGRNGGGDSGDQLFNHYELTVVDQTTTTNDAFSTVSAGMTVCANGGGGDGWSDGRRMTLSDVEQRDRKRDQFRIKAVDGACVKDGTIEEGENDDDDEAVGVLVAPSFWTKASVLGLLLVYMSATAFAFTAIQENWNFLDAFYFCLITLVTIGFGDFCPVEEHHYGGWIVFIFVGLILSTLTVDLVGASTIERIHTLGRGFDLGSFLTILGRGGGDSARLIQKFYAGAYQPADLKLIPYIDQTQQQHANNSSNNRSGVFMKSSQLLLPKTTKHNAPITNNHFGQNQTAENNGYPTSTMAEHSSFALCKDRGILLINPSNNNDEKENALSVEESQELRQKQQIISVTQFTNNFYAQKHR